MKMTLLALWVIAADSPCRAQPADDPPTTESGLSRGFESTLREALRPYLIGFQIDEAIACIPDDAAADREQARQNQRLLKKIEKRLAELEEEMRGLRLDAIIGILSGERLADAARFSEVRNEMPFLENLRRQVQNQTAAILEKYPCVAPEPPERPRAP